MGDTVLSTLLITEPPKRSQQAGIWVTRLVSSMTPPCLPVPDGAMLPRDTSSLQCPTLGALPGPPLGPTLSFPKAGVGGIIVLGTVLLPGGLMSEPESEISLNGHGG